jgi:hypothetical protein
LDAGEQVGWSRHPLGGGHLIAGRAGLAQGGQGKLVQPEPVALAQRQRRAHRDHRQRERVGDQGRDQELGDGGEQPGQHAGGGQDGELAGGQVERDPIGPLDVGGDARHQPRPQLRMPR